MHLVQISVQSSLSSYYSKLASWTTVLSLLHNVITACWLMHCLFHTSMQISILPVLQMRKFLHRNSGRSLTGTNLKQLLEISSPHYVDLIWGGWSWGGGGSEESCNSASNTSALKAEELGKPG